MPSFPPARAKFATVFLSQKICNVPALHGVYRLVCPIMKMAYVGQAYDLAHRFLEHRDDLRKGTHGNTRLQSAYNRYGPGALYFEVLEIWVGRWRPDCLSPAEQRWMDAHPRTMLFNIRKAGSDAWLLATKGQTRPTGRAPGTSSEKDWRNITGKKRKPPK